MEYVRIALALLFVGYVILQLADAAHKGY